MFMTSCELEESYLTITLEKMIEIYNYIVENLNKV